MAVQPALSGKKRTVSSSASQSRKKVKVRHDNVESLPWKSVARPSEASMGFEDGILELEEVDNVEVVYEKTAGGKIMRFSVVQDEAQGSQDDSPEVSTAIPAERQTSISRETSPISFHADESLPEWSPLPLHAKLLEAVHSQGFLSPTPIQNAAIPKALDGKDVIGIAQTGSGKTLAYGLPILHYLLSHPHPGTSRRPVRALILAPTRELALQVSSHLNTCLNTIIKGKDSDGSKRPPLVSVAAVVGGISAQKQRRILDRGVDVLVATPGRLWDTIEEDSILTTEIKNLRFLVLDEADRMIEAGHFAELENILRLTTRDSSDDVVPGDDGEQVGEATESTYESEVLQTFVFSATMSKDLQRNVKKGSRPKVSKKGSKTPSTLDELLLRLDFRDLDPEIIDLSPSGGVISTLKESRLLCLSADKDVYLYYFLLRYPGRSLVFLSAIDGIRRLLPLLDLLNIKAFPLHSQMEQRQRLKNLDRFKSIDNCVLLATDIAARGLDIPSIDHVIHYQIPRSSDVYVHRNGRTARAMREGFSMLMCGPDERKAVRILLGNLNREEDEIPEMSVDLGMLDKLKARVQLARQIETSHHKVKKANHEKNWMKEAAKALDVVLSEESDDDSQQQTTKKQRVKNSALKDQLKQMLSQPLVARGVSTRYITSGSNPIVNDLLSGDVHDSMLGIRKSEARNDLSTAKPRKKPRKARTSVDETEWGGIE